MAILKPMQSTMHAGELDERVQFRTDVRAYFNGLDKARNVVLLPQGGARRRPGMEFVVEQMPQLAEIDLADAAVTVTTPNGGTPANLVDDDESTVSTTSAVGTTDDFVLAHVDLGNALSVLFFDIRQVRLTSGATTSDGEVTCEYSLDNSAWVQFGSLGNPIDSVTATAKNRRFSNAAGAISARYWRIVRNGTTDLTTDTFVTGEIKMWRDNGTLSDARCIPHKFSTDQSYMMIATDRNLQVIRGGVVMANVSIPHTSAQLMHINWVQSLDNLFIFHEDVQVWNIERQGAHDEWDDGAQAFNNIPQFDFGSGAEDSWSATRGWPRCGTFHEGRLWMGGTAQRPSTFWGSVVDDLFNFSQTPVAADKAIEVTLAFDDVASITNIHSGRHLQIFTTTAEFYVLPDGAPIEPTTIARKLSTRVGSIRRGIRVAQIEGAVMFLERQGRGLREFIFTDNQQAYSADSLTLLASHLLDSPNALAARRSSVDSEGDFIFLVNEDGTMPVLQTLRSQDITGWALWLTEGKIKDVGVDNDDDIYVSVERVINSNTVRYVERFQEDYYTDSGLQFDTGLPTSTFAVAHLEAETCRVRADGAVLADVTVASGSVTIERDAETLAEIGLDFPDCKENEVTRLIAKGHSETEARLKVFGDSSGAGAGDGVWIRDNPFGADLQQGSPINDPKSTTEVTLSLNETQGLWLGANDEDPGEVTGIRVIGPDLLDVPPPLYTGRLTVTGLLGSNETAQVDITQRDPVPMTINGFRKKVYV